MLHIKTKCLIILFQNTQVLVEKTLIIALMDAHFVSERKKKQMNSDVAQRHL